MKPQMPLYRVALWIFLYLALGAFIIGTVVVAINTYTTADAIRKSQLSNKSTFDLVISCVTPGKDHDCYNRSQENQSQILKFLEVQQVAVAACTDALGAQEPQEIKACADRTMVQLGLPRQ